MLCQGKGPVTVQNSHFGIKRLQVYQKKRTYTASVNIEQEIQYNSSHCSTFLIISKLLWKLPNVCTIMLTGCHKYHVAHLELMTTPTTAAHRN